MKLTSNNYLTAIQTVITGNSAPNTLTPLLHDNTGGYFRDTDNFLNDIAPNTGTSYAIDSVGFPIISTQPAATYIGAYSFVVPRDYDQQTDYLRLRLMLKMNGATDTPSISTGVSTFAIGSTTPTFFSTVVGVSGTYSSTASSTLSQTLQEFEFDVPQAALVSNEVVVFSLSTSAHTTNSVYIYGASATYPSCTVAYLYQGSTGNLIAANDARGIPLRGY